MIVTAMLAWFNEDPATLHRAVTSAATIADRVVAVDGGWNLYPGAAPDSPAEQGDAIHQAAHQAGLECEVYDGRQWTGQVEKRDYMLGIAAQQSDWVMPLDADWELHGDRDAIRAELTTTTADSIIVPFHTPANQDAQLKDVAATPWHKNMAGTTVHEALIYRVLDDMHVQHFHWWYSGTRDGQRYSLWGQQPKTTPATRHQLQAPLVVNHWCLHRDQRTIQANREYCQQRDAVVATQGREP